MPVERSPRCVLPGLQVSAAGRGPGGRVAAEVAEVGEVEGDGPDGPDREVAPVSLAARWLRLRAGLRAWISPERSKAAETGRRQRRRSPPHQRHRRRRQLRGGHGVNRCAKYSLFCSQFTVAALGCLAVAVSLWGLADKERFTASSSSSPSASSAGRDGAALLPADPLLLPLLAGAASAALAGLGCAGALREKPPLLRAFAAGLGALVCAEAVGALAAYGARERVGEALASGVARGVERYRDDPDVRFIVDELQRGLRCCGVASYRDWERNVYFNCSSPGVQACGVPASCCLPQAEGDGGLPDPVANSQCGYGALRVSEAEALARVNAAGCAARVSAWFHANAGGLGAAAIVLLSAQVAALGLATKMLGDIEAVKSRW